MAKKLKLLNFKASEEEIAAWDAFANRTVHRNRSRWIRETLNNASNPTATRSTISTVFSAEDIPKITPTQSAQSLLDRAIETKAKNTKCEKRLPKGAFCKECGKIHG